MLDDILMFGFDHKYETYKLQTDARLLTCDKFAGTHKIFVDTRAGVYRQKNHCSHELYWIRFNLGMVFLILQRVGLI
jgi:hypothetical protein